MKSPHASLQPCLSNLTSSPSTPSFRSMSARGGRANSVPWSRLKPVNQDPLEAIGLPSKGDNRYVYCAVGAFDTLTILLTRGAGFSITKLKNDTIQRLWRDT